MFALNYIFWTLGSQIFGYKSTAISMYQTLSIQAINLFLVIFLLDWGIYLHWYCLSMKRGRESIASNRCLHQINHHNNYNIQEKEINYIKLQRTKHGMSATRINVTSEISPPKGMVENQCKPANLVNFKITTCKFNELQNYSTKTFQPIYRIRYQILHQ